MKTLKLDDKDAIALYKTADPAMKTLLEKNWGKDFFTKKITDKIDNIYDVCEILGIEYDNVIIFRKPNNTFEKYINACALIPKIVEAYNEGTILDWTNTSIYKYLPYFKKTGSGWSFLSYFFWASSSAGSASHHFKDPEHLKDAVRKFEHIYIDYYSYNG